MTSPLLSSLGWRTLQEKFRAVDIDRSRLLIESNGRAFIGALLPSDMLSEIFLVVLHDGGPLDDPKSEEYFQRLLTLASVCHQWRELILNSPSLWSARIECVENGKRWTQELLRRSQSAPLKVQILRKSSHIQSYSTTMQLPSMHLVSRRLPSLTENLYLLLDHTARIDEFEAIYRPEKDLDEVLLKFFTSRMPTLRSFTFDGGLDVGGGGPQFCVPQPIFENHAPELRKLRFSNCAFTPDFTFPVFESLRVLELIEIGPTGHTDLGCWIEFLSMLPYLEDLTMNNPINLSHASPELGRLDLPHLKDIKLSGRLEGPSLFSLLEPTHLRHFNLHFTDVALHTGIHIPLLESIATQVHSRNGPPPSCLKITLTDKTFEISTQQGGLGNLTYCINLTYTMPLSPLLNSSVKAIIQTLANDLMNCATLYSCMPISLDTSAFVTATTLLAALGGVRAISLTSTSYCLGFLSFLHQDRGHSDGLILPHLTSITIEGVNLSASHPHTQDLSVSDLLVSFLTDRQQKGHQLPMVRMRECVKISWSDIAHLEELGVWDGSAAEDLRGGDVHWPYIFIS